MESTRGDSYEGPYLTDFQRNVCFELVSLEGHLCGWCEHLWHKFFLQIIHLTQGGPQRKPELGRWALGRQEKECSSFLPALAF